MSTKDERELVGTLHPSAYRHDGPVPPALDDLALKFGTDKASTHHDYCGHYDDYLWLKRYSEITLLELGVGGHENPEQGGASLRMWREYFPNATIIGLDLEQKDFQIDGVHIVQGDQASPSGIADLAELYGPFDIVIDDASHLSRLTIKSFELLYPHLVPGGLYVVEDTHTSYHDWFYGRENACPDPDGTTMFGEPTTMQFLRRLADEVNLDPGADIEGRKWRLFPQRYWKGFHLESVQFFYDICFITKHRSAT